MKHYLRTLIIAGIAFYIAFSLIPTVTIGQDPKNLPVMIAGIFLTSMIIHPIFSLVLLPINILTFGFLSLFLNIALIFSLTKFLPGFAVAAYNFPGANLQGFILPAADMNQLEATIAFALIITVVQKLLHFILE